MVEPLDVGIEALRNALGAIPEFAAMAPEFTPYDRGDIDAALVRGKRRRGNITAWRFAPAAFRWSPAPGALYWVVTGRAAGKSLVAVLTPVTDGFQLAASTVLTGQRTTVAIGYAEAKRSQLLFTTCFGCPGESGDIRHQDGKLTVAYR